jgi:hypothetical protein
MGAFLSILLFGSPTAEAPPRNYILTFPEEQFPIEASRAPQDMHKWYYVFLGRISCIPHRDGKSMLIVEPYDDFPDSRERPGWPIKRLRGAYELLGTDHPRIVRWVCIMLNT